jgi:hypothetical protein
MDWSVVHAVERPEFKPQFHQKKKKKKKDDELYNVIRLARGVVQVVECSFARARS